MDTDERTSGDTMDHRSDHDNKVGREKTTDHNHGYAGQHGSGPHGGEFHLKKGARISDRGALGGKDRGQQRGELGSHSGSRRNRSNPGSDGGRSHDKS